MVLIHWKSLSQFYWYGYSGGFWGMKPTKQSNGSIQGWGYEFFLLFLSATVSSKQKPVQWVKNSKNACVPKFKEH